MTHRWISIAALPALLLSTGPARAGDSTTAPFAAPPPPSHGGSLDLPILAECNDNRLESIRWRPRRTRDRDRDWDRDRYRDRERDYGRGSRATGFSQIHAGFFDPDGDPPSSFLAGARAGGNIDDRVQIGLGLDWNHRSDRTTVLVREVPLPSGGTAERQTVLAQSSANLFPMMAFVQVSPGMDLPFSPYFGVGGGWEVLFLSADDFTTGEKFDATYGGWGWQVWGGASIPLSGRARLGGEVFLNNAEVERDVDDPESGQTLREVVPQDGVGMRFGLSWGF